MKCVKCGKELPDGSKFCDDCGAAQNKTCPSCNNILPLEAKFCFNCGYKFESNQEAADGISIGNKNVISGDIVGESENYSVTGDATIIQNRDETKKVKKCHLCGKNTSIIHTHTCPVCNNTVCDDCYSQAEGMCIDCSSKNKKSNENEYRDALKLVYADNKVDPNERRTLEALQLKLGISDARAMEMENEIKHNGIDNSSYTSIEKVNMEDAFNEFYINNEAEKAFDLMKSVYENHKYDENVLDLYLAILEEYKPNEAISIIDGLKADLLSGYLVKIGICIKNKDLSQAEQLLNAAEGLWPDNYLLKCRKIVWLFEMFNKTSRNDFLDRFYKELNELKSPSNKIEKVWFDKCSQIKTDYKNKLAEEEAERKRLEEEKRKEEERKLKEKEAEEKRLEEERKRKEEAEKERLRIQQQQAEEAERQRQEEDKRREEEAERKRIEEEKRQAEEAERERLAEEKRKAAEERRQAQLAYEKAHPIKTAIKKTNDNYRYDYDFARKFLGILSLVVTIASIVVGRATGSYSNFFFDICAIGIGLFSILSFALDDEYTAVFASINISLDFVIGVCTKTFIFPMSKLAFFILLAVIFLLNTILIIKDTLEQDLEESSKGLPVISITLIILSIVFNQTFKDYYSTPSIVSLWIFGIIGILSFISCLCLYDDTDEFNSGCGIGVGALTLLFIFSFNRLTPGSIVFFIVAFVAATITCIGQNNIDIGDAFKTLAAGIGGGTAVTLIVLGIFKLGNYLFG